MRWALIGVLTVLLLSGCQKKITKVEPDFVGEWTASGIYQGDRETLAISSSGRGVYECYEGDQRIVYAKGIARISEDIIKIGSTTLRVQQYPVEQPNSTGDAGSEPAVEWVMWLNNRRFTR